MYKNESLDEKLLGTINNSLNGPAIRNIYLRKATEEYDAGNISRSIFYQLESLCLTSRAKHFVQKKSVASEYISEDSDDKLIQFAKNLLTEPKIKKDQNENSCIEPIYEKDPIKGYQNILKFCDEIPKEWTVIHLCREFNPNTTFSLQSEISCNEDSIFLTVLKYPKPDKLKTKPFCIRLKNLQNDVFQKFVEVSTNLKERIRFDKDTNDNRLFWQGLNVVEEEMKVLLKSFKEFIGPWISLFSGDIYNNSNIQQSLFDAVDDFNQKYKLNDEKRNILNLIVRRVNLLSESHLKDICEYFANNEDNKTVLYKKLYEFLKVIKAKYDFDEFEYSPCILIVDETIDHFYWEMLNTRQEFCRISSFHIFKTLFQKYKNRIHKGYVQISIQSGNCLINPDKTLDRMEKRLNIFFKYWLSHWNCTYGQIPTSSIFLDCIQTANCFVYCGHGSGLQFLNGQHIAKLCTESVVFLFGCDSVRLKSDGIHSEMSGSHIYYHAALCPAVLGNLLPALDYQLDIISTLLLSIWIPSSTSSKRKTHWIHLNKNSWQKGENISESNICKSSLPEFEPRLTKILTFIKSDNSNNLYNRVGLISRGLPLWNSTNSKN